ESRLDAGPDYDGVMDRPKAAIARIGVDGGVDVEIRSDAPAGSGLGGSSALVTAVVAALLMLADRSVSPAEVAELAYRIERDDLGIRGGWQDQFAAADGGIHPVGVFPAGPGVCPVPARPGTPPGRPEHPLPCL